MMAPIPHYDVLIVRSFISLKTIIEMYAKGIVRYYYYFAIILPIINGIENDLDNIVIDQVVRNILYFRMVSDTFPLLLGQYCNCGKVYNC